MHCASRVIHVLADALGNALDHGLTDACSLNWSFDETRKCRCMSLMSLHVFDNTAVQQQQSSASAANGAAVSQLKRENAELRAELDRLLRSSQRNDSEV